MKYEVGDKVRIKSLDWYNENKDANNGVRCGNFTFYAAQYCGVTVTIALVNMNAGCYIMKEIDDVWTDEMIEGLVEEENKPKYEDEVNGEYYSTPKYLVRPSGYQFKDENGNVINATKIVLEKKKKDVSLTQEQINTMVHDSCVLFCKHFGCGIPRETCTSLGTCKDHDEYRTAIRTHLMEKKRTVYPKTYKECCGVLGIDVRDLDILDNMLDTSEIIYRKDLDRLLNSFRKLLICRDAYWKIAGEEMGLDKPWEPDWRNNLQHKHYISTEWDEIKTNFNSTTNKVLAFPTAEMRDAFKENFDPDIEFCKEFL